MAVIEKKIVLAGSKGKVEIIAFFDSEATYSCIRPELAESLGSAESLPEVRDSGTAEEGRTCEPWKRCDWISTSAAISSPMNL